LFHVSPGTAVSGSGQRQRYMTRMLKRGILEKLTARLEGEVIA
jgi:hypothetical protein